VRRRAALWLTAGAVVIGAGVLGWPAAVPQAQDRPLTRAPLPDGPLRILAFGTSLTARATWPDALGSALTACLGRPVTVSRWAKPGRNSDWALLQNDAIRAPRPHLVIAEFAINDADLRDGVSYAASAAQHQELVVMLKDVAPGAAVLLMTTNPVAGRYRLTRPWLADYYLSYRSVATAADAGLADLWPRWAGRNVGGDGLHPDTGTEQSIALPVLTGMIAARYGRQCG
jgi:acyl-CoA thioesterase-1